ncbi:MAG: DUF3108 domain-containing protein [Blastocatellia bacterium]
MLKTILAAVLVLAQYAIPAGAQVVQEKIAAMPKISKPLPFKAGESLLYEVGFSKLIFSGAIGEVRMSVSKAQHADKVSMLEIRADVISKGFFPKLFGIKINDRFSSQVNSIDFGLQTSSKIIEEGKVHREQKSVIDREAGSVTFTERDLENTSAEPKVKQAVSPSWIQDMLSACYFVRTQKLNEGDVIAIPISDGGQIYNIEVVIGKREVVKVDAGKFKTIKMIAKIFDGRYIKRSGEMFLWMSDDAKRIPVRAKIKTSGATVTVDLKRVQLTSES